ncbi:hypothetical protein ASE63_09780 [Bosea sp. Root381]|uniref:hypothetical protein n=1 Tax=Bosea sp. Root381 TaxID=1736524 RepID=UPI0007000FE6|nr:hypothetical protein [Bosea sp. Root381]KRE00345.1 hypothetical protein ASE63_09780 [Bosea sp. Root381]
MKHVFAVTVLAAAFAYPGMLAAQELPPSISGLGLTDVQIRQKPHVEYGSNVYGTLPGGARIKIELERNGTIEEIEARGRGLFPIDQIRSLVPAPVLKSPSWPADAMLEKIEFERGGRIEIEGRLADGREFDAEFEADGRVIDFDTDD